MTSNLLSAEVRRRKVGFTLVEIMIVVTIIGLLAAISLPIWTKARQKSQVSAFVNDLKKGVEAIQRCAFETGDWPTDVATATCPPEMVGFLGTDYWSKTTPLGGNWDWNYGGSPVTGSLSVVNPTLANAMADVDLAVDDGNLSTGNFQQSGSTFTYIVQQ